MRHVSTSSSSQGAVAAHPPGASAIVLAAEREGRAARPTAGVLWMVLAQALFAVMNVLSRLSSESAPWPEVAASRALVGAATALGVALVRRAPLSMERSDRRLTWARSLCGTGAMLCVFYTLGSPQIALGDAVTLGATSPIFVAILAPRMLGERSSRGLWVAILLAFAGVALIAAPRLAIAGETALVATLGAVFSAFAMIWLRRIGASGTRASPESVALHFSLVASAAMIALSIPVWRTPDAVGVALLIGTGLAGGLAQLAMTRAYALDNAARIGAIGYVGVALSHVLAAAWLGDVPSARQVLGATLVMAAGLWLASQALRDARRPARRSTR
ncbi:DMT family transporter [Sorangium cellulosum]|uniref:DMT family transporter n=1 Tax=Sorangium TaxID=39643 RepID=UPI0009D78969|nr:DMT family transporter [Sorangium cellulosum]